LQCKGFFAPITLGSYTVALSKNKEIEMGPGNKKQQTTHTNKDLAKWNKQQYGDSDERNFGAAHHQARNDYQDAGSPFGKLSSRERKSKTDTEAK
jgi:hypothetical protein